MKRFLLLGILAAAPAMAGYLYDVAGIDPYAFGGGVATANGDMTTDYTTGLQQAYMGGSYILTPSVPTTPNDYEILSPISIESGGGGGTFIHFLRASSGAYVAGAACYGNSTSVELYVPYPASLFVNAATLSVNTCVSGTRTHLASASVPVQSGDILRSVIFGTTLYVYLNNRMVMDQTVPATTGQPGIGALGMMSATTGFPESNYLTNIRVGHHDTVAPNAVSPTGIASSLLPNQVSLQWQGATDDSNGIGVYQYTVARNGTVIGNVDGAEFTDSTVSPSTTYTYSISAVDYHGNTGTATTVSVTTPASPAVDPRRTGVMATGSYWGGGGEQIDMLSGNLNFSVPLVTAQSRAGWSVPVALSYNSQNWRQDGSVNWQLGADVGYGYGWKLQIGSITPFYNGTGMGVHHYVFSDSTGAQYRLDQNSGSVWSSRQGVYVWFDAATNEVHFKNGMFWYMGCTSGGAEPDAGTMYPTAIEDKDGNQVLVSYLGATSLPYGSVNSSGRILYIEDFRGGGTSNYGFSYYSPGGVYHLATVYSYLGGSVTYASTTYTTGATLMPPFGTDPAYSGQTTIQLASITVPSAGSWSFTYDSSGASELQKVTYPWGGYLEWSYATAAYAGSRSLREVNNRYLYSQAVSGGTVQGPYPITHSDTGVSGGIPTVHVDTTLVDASGNGAKKWSFNTSSGTPWEIGLVSEFDQKTSASGTLITQDNYTWAQTPTSLNPYIASKTSVKDPGTGSAASALTTQTQDQYGNTTQTAIYPWNNTTTPVKTYNATYVTTSTYLTNYLVGLLASASETFGGTTTTLVTNNYDYYTSSPCPSYYGGAPTLEYDSSALSFGKLTRSVTPAGTAYQCFAFGLMYAAVGVDGTTTSGTFSSASNYSAPDTITSPTYSTSMTYNAWVGLTQTAGVNGETISLTYDSAGRPATATSPYGAVTTYAYSSAGTVPVWQKKYGPDGFTRTTLDGFGRAILVERGPDASTIVSKVDTVYAPCACSPMEKLQKASQPYAPGATEYWTTYSYDGIGRTVSVQQPDGASTSTYSYAGNQTTVTDPAGNWKKFTSDVEGNLITVVEPDPANLPSGTLSTSYAYDWMNHLTGTSMTRAGTTQTRSFVYNAAGQLTSATNPENGTVSYTYNTDTTLATKTDAKGQIAAYSYDSAKRVTMVQYYPYSGGWEDTCQRVTYGYDATTYGSGYSAVPTYGSGRLTSVQYGGLYTPGVSTTVSGCAGAAAAYAYEDDYIYHPAGTVTEKIFNVTANTPSGFAHSANINSTYTYDTAGRLSTVKSPWVSSPTYTYTYDSMGRPLSMTDSVTQWVQDAQYDAAGRRTSLTMFEGYPGGSTAYYNFLTQTTTYNANGQIASLGQAYAAPYSSYYNVALTYSFSPTQNNGQITQMVDTVSGETVSYAYDALKRLTSAAATPNVGTTPAAWTQTFQYDGFGNLTAKVLNGTTSTIGVNAANNRLSSSSYDLNGNMLTGVGATYTYDESNRMASASPTSGGTEYYAYGPDNKRLYRWNPSTGVEEWTLYGGMGEKIGNFYVTIGWSDVGIQQTAGYLWFAGKLVSRVTWVGASLPFRDRVGTDRMTGNYLPYGEQIGSSANDREKFATYTRDSFTTLDYADQRYYASSYGRFNTVDSGAVSTKDPVTWNRYSYTGGDPINRNDPRGTCWGNNEDGPDQVLEDWEWDYGERWTEAGWEHTDGGCFQGSAWAEALGQCNLISGALGWSSTGYTCDAPTVPTIAFVAPPPPCWQDIGKINQTLVDLGENVVEIAEKRGHITNATEIASLKQDITSTIQSEDQQDLFAFTAPPSFYVGGHFNLDLSAAGLQAALGLTDYTAFARAFGGFSDGTRQPAVYGNAAQGNYTLHSKQRRPSGDFDVHFDLYNPLSVIPITTIQHLFGDVIGGHVGIPCLDPAWQ